MRRVFGAAAPDIISLERSVQKNSPEKRATRLNAAREHWYEIRSLLAALPSGEQVVQTLRAVGSPVNPREIELPPGAVRDGILYAKEVRDRYTQQQLAWDIGGLPGWAEEITEELFNI
jgi:glycerol-1-phosphate dehydrogenase [NAD(P)+]